MECVEVEKCSRCGSEAEIFCGSCMQWHCLLCYEREDDELWGWGE